MRLVTAVLVLGLASRLTAADPTFSAEQVALYEKQVLPVLKASCLKCHGDDPKKVKGGLLLTSRAAVLKGGDTGPAFDAKNPDASLLLKAVHYKDGLEMPPSGKLPADTVKLFEQWVKAGLPFTPSKDDATQQHGRGGALDRNYWAYQPVKRPAVPAVKDAAWVKTQIDAFILAKLEAKGLKPVGPADKVALIRRAHYDLTGLPPTPEQVDEFVADPSPDAFARLVDKLL